MMTDDTTATPAEASMSDDAREQLVTELVNRAHAEGGDMRSGASADVGGYGPVRTERATG